MSKSAKKTAATKTTAKAAKAAPPKIAPTKAFVSKWLQDNPGISGRELCRRAKISESVIKQGMQPHRLHQDFSDDSLAQLATVMATTPDAMKGQGPSAAAPGLADSGSSPVAATAGRDGAAAGGTSLPANALHGQLVWLRHDQVRPDPDQPRKLFDPEKLQALATTIVANGILTPATVRPDPDHADGFVIIFGERRWRAYGQAIKSKSLPKNEPGYPAIIKNVNAAEARRMQMVENIIRDDMHPLEEGEGFLRMRDLDGVSTKQLALDFNKTQKWVQVRIQFAERLSDAAKAKFLRDEMNIGAARELVKAPFDQQNTILDAIDADTGEHEVRDMLRADAMPVEAAIFAPKLYKGGMLTDEDGKPTHYANGAEAMALQKTAIRESLARFKKDGWAFAEEKPGHFHPSLQGFTKSTDMKKAGIFMAVDAMTMAVTVFKGWAPPVEKEQTPEEFKTWGPKNPTTLQRIAKGKEKFLSGTKPADPLKQVEAGLAAAAERRTEALQMAAASFDLPNGDMLAMAVVCYGFFDATQGRTIRMRPEHPHSLPFRLDVRVRALVKRAMDTGLLSSDLIVTAGREADFLHWLLDQGDTESEAPHISDNLQQLFQVLVASTLGDFSRGNPQLGAAPLACFIAEATGARAWLGFNLGDYLANRDRAFLLRVAAAACPGFTPEAAPDGDDDLRAWVHANADRDWLPPETDFLTTAEVYEALGASEAAKAVEQAEAAQ